MLISPNYEPKYARLLSNTNHFNKDKSENFSAMVIYLIERKTDEGVKRF